MTKKLDGRVAIVTGGAGGIGEAYARGLAAEGASVVIADINAEAATKVASGMAADGHTAIGVALDVTDPASAKALADTTRDRFGRIDVLVNNAALMSEIPKDPLTTIPIEFWDETFTTQEAEAARPGRKRDDPPDARAAAVMLQSYIDSRRPAPDNDS